MKKVRINDEMSKLFHTKWNYTYPIVITKKIESYNLAKEYFKGLNLGKTQYEYKAEKKK